MANKGRICAECAFWFMGDMWQSGSHNHGFTIECKGWCRVRDNKRKRWNYAE